MLHQIKILIFIACVLLTIIKNGGKTYQFLELVSGGSPQKTQLT